MWEGYITATRPKGYICRMRGAYLAGGTNERTDEQLVDADTSHTNYGDT